MLTVAEHCPPLAGTRGADSTRWPGSGRGVGFASGPTVPGTADAGLGGLTITTNGHTAAAGLYRSPTRRTAGWTSGGLGALSPSGRVELRAVTHRTVGRYDITGFAMAVVTGTLTAAAGSGTSLYGFGELLAGGPLLRWLT